MDKKPNLNEGQTNAKNLSNTPLISLETEHDYLTKLGPRLTGSPAHKDLIERVAKAFSDLGMTVQHDPIEFDRWYIPSKEHLQLWIGGQNIQIASAYPYSGMTGPNGIQANLVLVKSNEKEDWEKARGAIAVMEVNHIPLPYDLFLSTWDNNKIKGNLNNPLISATLFGPSLEKAKQAGVLAVIGVWRNLSDGNAQGQYIPFTLPYQDLPALWVSGESGKQVLAAAKEKQSAKLVLDAVIEPNCKTETIWAVSPGKLSNETIIVTTHSDGVNVVEENGHLGLLQLAEQASKIPHNRTIVFAFITGHMRIPAVTKHGQATAAWLEKHPEYWRNNANEAKAVGALVIEHLGALEYVDTPSGEYKATGQPEMETLYATTPELNKLVNQRWRGTNQSPKNAFKPSPLLHFGEGEPFFERRIPSVALVTGPSYLLAEFEGELVDMDVLRRQVNSFSDLMWAYDKMPISEFGLVDYPSEQTKHAAEIEVSKAFKV